MTNDKWEYASFACEGDDLEMELDHLGMEGFRLVSVHPIDDGYRVVMERRMDPE